MAVWVAAQDVAGNVSQIGWQLWVDKTSYSPTSSGGAAFRWMRLNGVYVHEFYGNGYNFVTGDNFLLASGYTWFSHNADGTLPMFCEAQADFDILGATGVASTWLTVPNIPRASTSSFSLVAGPAVTEFDAGTPLTIHTNRSSTAFTHELIVSFANGAYYQTIATGVGATYNWTPPLSLLTHIPNATSGVGFVRTRTYNGATFIGQIDTVFTLKAGAGVVPTIASLTVSDANPAVNPIVGTFVQGLSILQATVNASGVQGSTIVSRAFTMSGSTVASGGQIPVTASGTVPVSATATDSRGRVGSFNGSISALAYATPQITAAQVRRSTSGGVLDDNGTSLRVDLTAAVQSLINSTQRNSLTYKVFTRLRGAGVWTARNSTLHGSLTYNSNFVVSGGANYPIDDAFEVKIEVVDKFNTAFIILEVPTAAIFMEWTKDNIGIGKYWQMGRVDVQGDIYSDARLVPVVATDTEAKAKTSAEHAVTPLNLAALTATQTEVDTGTDTTEFVTPATMRGADWLPWAEAAGSAAGPASGTVTVTFPAGRFTQPPIVSCQALSHANVVVVRMASDPTTTGFTAHAFTVGGAQVAVNFNWHAVQMSSGASPG
jgi:hypothetical protein